MPFENTFTSRIYNRPLLIAPSYMAILSQRQVPVLSDADIELLIAAASPEPRLNNENGIVIINVNGFLFYHADPFMERIFGDTSYETIRAQHQAALSDPSVKNIIFRISSYGGEAAGVFDLVDEIYQARGTKPTYAVFDDNGFSGAFAIASAAGKRYISRTGGAGSVGVVAMHVDQSGLDEKVGLVYTPVFAGAHKVDYSSHAPLSPEALASLQADINDTYELFVNTVARNLGMTPAAVKATEAAIYTGKKAVQAGFADAVMSWNQFLSKLQNRKYGGIMKTEIEKLFNEMRDKFKAMVSADPEAAAKEDVVTKTDADALIKTAEEAARAEGRAEGQKEGHKTGYTEGLEAGKKELQTRNLAIIEICALAKMETAALGYIKDETLSVEDVRQKVTAEQAADAERNGIRSSVGAISTGAVNPLVANAQKRAEAATGHNLTRVK
ncbi:MAG: S49 family peptidase [Deltaproteobacteria bacterium]|nr:S49 family peptidase [Deltaproteobacteria bacterium]